MSQLHQFSTATTSAAAKKLRTFRTKLKNEGFPEPYEHAKIIKRIVAVGGQSAGKSALISMLTGIKLESSSSATTRGPTVFRFGKGSSPSASAKIWVEIVEDEAGKVLPKMLREKETVVSVAELPEKHREYARLVLNADIDDGELIDDYPLIATDRPITECGDKFTRNRIVIELLGDNYPTLEIVDVPGLQASNEDKCIQDKIWAMTEEELAKPRTLALILCPATSEPVHHSILNHIRRTDGKYERTIIALSRADELTAQTTPWLDEMAKFPDSHCFVASAVSAGLQEDLVAREKSEARALNASKKAHYHVLHQVPSAALGVANLTRMVIAKFGSEERRRLTDLVQSFKEEIKTADEDAAASNQPEMIAAINLSIDHISSQLSNALIAFESSDTEKRDPHATFLRKALQPLLAAVNTESHSALSLSTGVVLASDLDSEESFDRFRRAIQKDWVPVVTDYFHKVSLHCRSLLDCLNKENRIPSPAMAKVMQAIEGLVEECVTQASLQIGHLTRRYCGQNRLMCVGTDPTAIELYRTCFLDAKANSVPSTPVTTRMDLPLTPPSSVSSKRSAAEQLESPRRKKWSQSDFIFDLKERNNEHRLRTLYIYIKVCFDRLCDGYRDVVSEMLTQLAASNLAHNIRSRIGTNGYIDSDTVKALMTSEDNVKAVAERRSKIEELVLLGQAALSV